jgi:hypothetical protein
MDLQVVSNLEGFDSDTDDENISSCVAQSWKYYKDKRKLALNMEK